MNGKKILTIQDLSCVGQCSLTAALPVLSHYGMEAAILPTAVLSNHTMFKSWSYLDLTDEIKNIYQNWENNGITFSGFLLGYLGKVSIMSLCEQAFDKFSCDGAPVIIDPVMGDNGKLYPGFDGTYVEAMRHLIGRADIILPNLTEVCNLIGEEYTETYDKGYIERVIRKLTAYAKGTVIITGVELDGLIGEAILCGDKVEYVLSRKVPKRAHGTGDIFAAAFTAHYLNGDSLKDSCKKAGDLIAACLDETPDAHFYGVCFEDILSKE